METQILFELAKELRNISRLLEDIAKCLKKDPEPHVTHRMKRIGVGPQRSDKIQPKARSHFEHNFFTEENRRQNITGKLRQKSRSDAASVQSSKQHLYKQKPRSDAASVQSSNQHLYKHE